MRYQKVHSRLWTEARFRSWSDDGRLLALYLVTCPHRNTEGLFRLPVPLAAYDLGWPPQRAAEALAELQATRFVDVDPDVDLVWLVDALLWDHPVGPKQVKGAVNALAELPESPLRARYLDAARSSCPELAKAIIATLGWVSDPEPQALDTPSIGYPESEEQPEETPSIAPSPPRCSIPNHHPRSTQEGPVDKSGGGGSSEAEQVVAAAIPHLRLAKPGPPTPPEIRYVERALARGWSASVLTAVAFDAGTRAEVTSPRSWTVQAWKRMANEDPPDPDGAVPIPPVPGEPLARFHPDDCPGGCDHDGWVTTDGGLARCTGQPIEATA